jgi:hypothetical protein
MSGEWHRGMQEKFKYYGEMLGFKAEAEVKIPRGKIDCVWESKEPVSEYFIAFKAANSETSVSMNIYILKPQNKKRFRVSCALRKAGIRYVIGPQGGGYVLSEDEEKAEKYLNPTMRNLSESMKQLSERGAYA